MRHTRLLLLMLVTIATITTACGGEDSPPPSPTPRPTEIPTPAIPPSPTPLPTPLPAESPGERAQLRVVHASPDLPSVSIYLDGANIGSGFTAGSYHQTPLKVRMGDYLLRVVPTGENPDLVPHLIEQRITVPPQKNLIIVLAGHEGAYGVIVAEEDISPLPAGTARLSVINALPDSGTLTIQETSQSVIADLTSGTASPPVELAEGEHSFALVDDTGQLGTLNLYSMARHAYTLVLFPDPDTGEVQTVKFRSRVEDISQVRVVHASPDLEPVAVYLDDMLLAESLAYRTAGNWSTLRSASYQLRVLPANDPDAPPIYQKQIALRPDEAVDLVLLDTRDRLRVSTIPEDLSPTPVDAARLTFVHAAVDAIQVTIKTFGGEIPGLRPISFGTAAQPRLLAAGREAFIFETGRSDAPREVDLLPERTWDAGFAYLVLITDTPNAPPVVLATGVGTDETQFADTEEIAPGESLIAPGGPAQGSGKLSMRVVNALTDAASIDLEADGQAIFEAVVFAAPTDYHTFDRPPEHIAIRRSDNGSILIDTAIVLDTTAEDTQITLYVFYGEAGATYQLATDIPIAIPDGQTMLRIFHAAPEKPQLRVERPASVASGLSPTGESDSGGTTGDPEPVPQLSEEEELGLMPEVLITVVEQLEFGLASDPQFVPAETYPLTITEQETGFIAGMLPATTFESRAMVDLLLLPDSSGLGLNPVLIAYEPAP